METPEFIVHKIREEDTLTLLAKRIGINPIDLKFFHNSICSYDKRIYFDNLSYYSFIYIPILKLSDQDIFIEKYSERPSQFFSPQLYSSKYNVQETMGNKEGEESTINYSVELECYQEEGDHFVSIQLYDFKKNNHKPEDKVSLLAIACTQALYPLVFKMSAKGEIVSIANQKEIAQNFVHHRERIEDYHIGRFTKEYLDMMERNLNDELIFLSRIKSTPIFRVLFPNLEWFYKRSSWEETLFDDEKGEPNLFQLSADYFHNDRIVVETEIHGIANSSDLTINYKTAKIAKNLVEVSADIHRKNDFRRLKITPLI